MWNLCSYTSLSSFLPKRDSAKMRRSQQKETGDELSAAETAVQPKAANRTRGKVLSWRTCVQRVKRGICMKPMKITTGESFKSVHSQNKLTPGPIKARQWDLPCFSPSSLLSIPSNSALWVGKRVKGPIGKIKERICLSHPTISFRSEAEKAGGDEKLSFGMNLQHWFLHWTGFHSYWNETFYLKVIGVHLWYMWIIRKVMWMKIQGTEEKWLTEEI